MEFDRENGGKVIGMVFSVFILIRLLLARYTLHYFGFFFLSPFKRRL